jgi:predicted ATP-binding protein involved in virulence
MIGKEVCEDRIIEYFENLGYHKDMISFGNKISNGMLDFSVKAFGRIIIYGDYIIEKNEVHRFLSPNTSKETYFVILYHNTEDSKFSIWKDSIGRPINEAVPFSHFVPTFQELHEEIFQFLYQKYEEDNNFLFMLRQTNRGQRLNEGYWFTGSDDYLVTSFWSGNDWKSRGYYIRIGITNKGNMWCDYTAKSSKELQNFFGKISKLNGLKQETHNGKLLNSWRKVYSLKSETYLEMIEAFLEKDKIIIDTFINNALKIENKDLENLDFINKENFNNWIENIQKYRNFNRGNVEIQSIDYSQHSIGLKTLKLKNIGTFQSFELDLSKRVICILGENGIGKTTVLRALILALIGATSDEKSYLDLANPTLQNMLRIKDKNSKAEIEFTKKGTIELYYNHGEPVKNEIKFSSEFNLVREYAWIESIENEEITSFTANKDGFEFTQLIIGFAQVRGEKVDKRIKDKKPNIVDVLPLLYNEVDNRFEDLSQWIIGLHGNANTGNKENDKLVLELLFKVVSDITQTKVELAGANFITKLLWIKMNDESPILFDLLSSGYRNIFIWAGILIKRMSEANDYVADFMERPAIVIIDEIDTYLHPKWQRNILNVLAKSFVNTRFIVTTHSPLVASHLEVEDKAVFVIKEGGKVEEVPFVYGQNLKTIYRKVGGLKDDRPKEIDDKIDKMFDLIDNDTKESMNAAKEIFDELEKTLSSDDVDIVQAETYFELSQ